MTDIQQHLNNELDQYQGGAIDRREFFRRAGLVGISAAAAGAMLRSAPAFAAPSAAAMSPFHVEDGDPGVATAWTTFKSTDGAPVQLYTAWPAGATGNLPVVAVCQQNVGMNEHIADVTRRFAMQGYMAIAPDLLSHVGPPTRELTADGIRAAQSRLASAQNPLDFSAALDFIRNDPRVNPSQLAAVGFCFGGGVVWQLATIYPDLLAAAPFYGAVPSGAAIPNIRAAVLAHLPQLDVRTTSTTLDAREALDSAGVKYALNIYGGAAHAFHDDTREEVYDQTTAVQAFGSTLGWFAQHLGLPAPMMSM